MQSLSSMKANRKVCCLMATLSVLAPVTGTLASPDTVVVQWNNAALEAIRDTHPGPPMVARMLAVLNTSIFDAWAAYDPVAVGTRMGASLRRPAGERTDANKQAAISYAAYDALVDLFPSEKAKFDQQLVQLGYDPADKSANPATAVGVGHLAAEAVLAFRHADGSNQLGEKNGGAPYSDYTGYVAVNTPDLIRDPDRWQPLRVPDNHGGSVIQKYIAPHWGSVTPFAIGSYAQYRNRYIHTEPYKFGDRRFIKQAKQILNYSANLTDRQKVIAEYWADGPSSELPPGHWGLFAQFVSRRDHHNLDSDAKMFFALSNAILDASVVGWGVKRDFDSVRPVTAIHYLFQGKPVRAWAGPGKDNAWINGEDWQPYQAATVVTPPFPEYFSGHSIFSAAGATILKLYTGSDRFGASVTIAKGSSRVEPGLVPKKDLTLKWRKFSVAADEAGISRRFGGIHFLAGDLDARKQGRIIGTLAWEKALTYIEGTAN